MNRVAVWHRNDLRVEDNIALYRASKNGSMSPIFIFDDAFYNSGIVSDSRIEFMHESLDQLDNKYSDMGLSISYFRGDPTKIVDDLISENLIDSLYFNASVTDGYSLERDKKLQKRDKVKCFTDDAIVRTGESRENWRQQAEEYFESDTVPTPSNPESFNLDSNSSISKIESIHNVDSNMERRHFGGCEEAKDTLSEFVDNISEYVGGISSPIKAEERTSQLSPYIKFGCISPRKCYKYSKDKAEDDRATDMFTSRLFWNQHFKQKLQDNPDLRQYAVNPVFRGINRDSHSPELHKKWKNGRTGYPMVDASMRSLKQTGWINFRMRAMCSSFYTFILRCWWKKGADWFYKKLVDADPAINYAQWQMQSGLVGVHPLRIYNPRKQVRDNDPNGEFIKKYVPELRDFPAEFLDRPEKSPLSVQEKCGVEIGKDYPYPVVEFEKKRDKARDYWSSLSKRAKEALKDPEVRKKASLSKNRRSQLKEDSKEDMSRGQTKIQDFS